jgi:asparagine synthase (glutamine-hydrolysing)
MCGIVGILNQSASQSVDSRLLGAMRDTMAHRGPDGAGSWVSDDGNVALAHRRLSIIDLSTAASQPMANRGRDLWITFNGEIYNHVELRAELERLGRTEWQTDHSDTEVILQAYEQWGIDCVTRFRGMFAFGLWDSQSQCLWLVRDRLGKKPLYWAQFNGRFYFASEIKAIIEDPAVPRSIDEEAVFHYLTFMTTPAPLTMFQGIKKLGAGQRMRVTREGCGPVEQWWDVFDNVQKDHQRDDDEWAKLIRDKLAEAVRYRGVADVPVGVFLSGGIDSSTNAALFSIESGNKGVKTFTIGYKNATTYSNEHGYAREVAKLYQTQHHELDIDAKDVIDFLPKLVHHQDEPIADPVCIPVYYVSKLARNNGVVVAQLGEGADELFWGYPLWRIVLRLQKLNSVPLLGWLKHALLAVLRGIGKSDTLYYELLRRGAANQRIFWSGAIVFTERAKAKILSARMRAKFAGRSSYEVVDRLYQQFLKTAPERSDLDWMTYSDLHLRLPELLLMRVDKMSMATSLEGRVPFLDHEFVRVAMSVPESVKTRNGVLKHILKRAVRGLIPDALIDRKKQGFGVPITEWTLAHFKADALSWVSEFARATDLIDEEEALRIIRSGNANAWYLVNLALWWRHFIKK